METNCRDIQQQNKNPVYLKSLVQLHKHLRVHLYSKDNNKPGAEFVSIYEYLLIYYEQVDIHCQKKTHAELVLHEKYQNQFFN